jgi:hypothetical protein
LTIPDVVSVLKETGAGYFRGAFMGGYGSDEANLVLRTLDDTMYRLYEARSASAVMINVPEQIPYFYGETFVQALYALVPRYFWPEKPSLNEANLVTQWVMPDDSGFNPTGTLAEFYMNFGFLGVLAGGAVCFLLCAWAESVLTSRRTKNPAWLCVYPLLAEQFLIANTTFTRRISEGLRGVLVLVLMMLLFWLAKRLILPAALRGNRLLPSTR